MNLLKLSDDLEVFHHNAGETRAMYQEIFVDRCYARAAHDLKRGDIVFDVGANIGVATLYLHRTCPGLRFFCFEPLASVSAILRANVEKHGIDATVITAAVADVSGPVTFTYYPNNTVMSGLHGDPDEDRKVTRYYLENSGFDEESVTYFLKAKFEMAQAQCEVVRLSDVIKQFGVDRIDVLKVDVEKSEWQVLAGIAPEHWSTIQRVCVEVHDTENRLSSVLHLLGQHGFVSEVHQNPLLKGTGLCDVFAARP